MNIIRYDSRRSLKSVFFLDEDVPFPDEADVLYLTVKDIYATGLPYVELPAPRFTGPARIMLPTAAPWLGQLFKAPATLLAGDYMTLHSYGDGMQGPYFNLETAEEGPVTSPNVRAMSAAVQIQTIQRVLGTYEEDIF